nr:NAD(P)H-hydrate dehydratase [Desulfovibrio sp. ZJ369]
MRTAADFFDMLPALPLPAEMRRWDEASVTLGLPDVMLMENAARSALAALREHIPDLAGHKIWLFMGSGNNGGDAACLARHLLDAGARPLVWHTRPLKSYAGATARHIRMARATGVPFAFLRRPDLPDWKAAPEIIVDGLLGTGFNGDLRPDLAELVQRLNALDPPRFVLALDIPSGLDGVTGRPCPIAVRATATVSFAAAKPGLILPWARAWTGTLHVRAIGIPAVVRKTCPCSAYLLDGRSLAALPSPAAESYKNSFGHVLVLGGAPGLGGAAHLASRAALRAGAGLVTAAAPAASVTEIKNGWPEIMTLALGEPDQCHWPSEIPETLGHLLERCGALVVGPGMGRGKEAAAFLASVLALDNRPPAVFDADALILLAREPALLRKINERDILTPHPGEAAALLQCAAPVVQADRFAALAALCRGCLGTVVLKGAGTLAGQGQGPLLASPYDVPQLAVGGSGDVLAGCLGGLLAACQAGWQTSLPVAGMGVALHALAGRACARRYPARGNTAGEVADALPHVRARLALATPDQEILPWPS